MLNIPTSVSRVEAPTHVLLPLSWPHAPSSVGREIEPHRLRHGGWLLCTMRTGRRRGETEKIRGFKSLDAISDSRFNAQPPLIEAILTVVRVV